MARMEIDVDQTRRMIRGGEQASAFKLLESIPHPVEAAQAFHAVAKELYWKDRDLVSARGTLVQGIAFALSPTFSESAEVRGAAKAMCYDLGSFCWPGWDEPDIEIEREDLTMGQAAADRNLELAIELERGDGPLANAHFLVGGFHLAWSRLPEAAASFERYHHHATLAGDEAQMMVSRGYQALVRHLEGDPDAEEEFLSICAELEKDEVEHGAFFAEQLETARSVFE